MRQSSNTRYVVLILVGLLLIAQIFTVFAAWHRYTLSNAIFYYIAAGMALYGLFGKKSHVVWATMWSIMTAYVLGIFGPIVVISYWGLFVIKRKQSVDGFEGEDGSSEFEEDDSKVITMYGRLPFLRIPLPWLKYTLDLEHLILTRDNFFPDWDRDDGRHDLVGKDDDLLLKQVFDWAFSTKLWRLLAGTSCFVFQSKKIGRSGDKRTHWHCIPSELVEDLRRALIEAQN